MSTLRRTDWKFSDMKLFLDYHKHFNETDEKKIEKFICICLLNEGKTVEEILELVKNKDYIDAIKQVYM